MRVRFEIASHLDISSGHYIVLDLLSAFHAHSYRIGSLAARRVAPRHLSCSGIAIERRSLEVAEGASKNVPR